MQEMIVIALVIAAFGYLVYTKLRGLRKKDCGEGCACAPNKELSIKK